MKRIVIVGATSTIAEHCARVWVKEPVDLILIGRNQVKLAIVAQDLRVRSPQSLISIQTANFKDSEAIDVTISELSQTPVDVALIAHGSLPDQPECQSNLTLCKTTLEVNAISPVLFAEAFVRHMEEVNKGTLAIIGSVAGDRGRKSNYVYGAAKGLVTRYAQGLQHRLAKTDVKIVLIKPGPTDTPMTASLKGNGAKLAPVESVAKQIVQAIEAGKPVTYSPTKWCLVMMIIRHLPAFVFNKINI